MYVASVVKEIMWTRGYTMKILFAVVDKRPKTCAECPLCAEIRKGYECGKAEIAHKGHAVQYIKVPDSNCLLKKG